MEDNKTMQDYLFDFAYGEALRDATLMKSFAGEKAYLKNCCEGKKVVREYVDGILSGSQEKTFDATENAVEEAFNNFIEDNGGNQEFTFGNAQKLINMTVKYMFLSAYTQDDYNSFRELFADCHCPMDSIMCQIVKDVFDRDVSEDAEIIKQNYKDGRKTWKSKLNVPWSGMKKDEDGRVPVEYACFQEIVEYLAKKEKIYPIEFDYKYWNQNAERRCSDEFDDA